MNSNNEVDGKVGLGKYKIEKGIEMPDYGNSYTEFPFKIMEVGDSFEIPAHKRGSAMSSSRSWGVRQTPERKFSSRTTSESKVRIWRIK
jgi:hypothetical protein